MALRDQAEQHIEVHKYSWLAVWGTVFLALLLQASLPAYFHFRQARFLELPLLVTLYFGLSRRNPSTGLLLGMVIGLAQDAVSSTQAEPTIGLYGIAKTLVGFGASSIGARLDVEHPVARALLTFLFFHAHRVVFVFTERLLLQKEGDSFFSTDLLIASLVNALLSILLFPLLDRLRQ